MYLFIYLFIYLCIYVFMIIYIYVYAFRLLCIYTYMHGYTHIHACMHPSAVHACMHACVHACRHLSTHTCLHVCVPTTYADVIYMRMRMLTLIFALILRHVYRIPSAHQCCRLRLGHDATETQPQPESLLGAWVAALLRPMKDVCLSHVRVPATPTSSRHCTAQ